MRVEVVHAWPRRLEARTLELPEGATVADAAQASGFDLADVVAYSVFGVRAEPAQALRDGDRVELLRPLLADPKEARRRRAASRPR